MKKLFLLLALLGIVATGCSKYEVDKGNDNKTEQPNEDEGGNISDDAYISLNKDIVTISPDGESVDVKVYSNYAWELTNKCDWITTSITSGDASDTGVIVTLTADLTYDDREGTIVFSCGNAKKLLVVSQKFKEAIIPDANNTFNIPIEGGVAVITYQTTVDCEVIIPEEAQDWITIAPASRGLVSESITLNVAENTTYSARTAVVKVVAKYNAELTVEYTINQEQNDAILANGNTEFTISGREQQITIKHKANIDCEVIIPDEAQDWVNIAPATRGLSTYSTTLNIAENNSGKERSCVVKVTSQGDNELSAEYTITQNPRCFLYYTSSNGYIVDPYTSSNFDATILSNTYKDGVGIIEFNAPITKIGNSAFDDCRSLTSITIPDSVTTIGSYVFYGCRSLTSITIPDSVTTIGSYVFYGCRSLTSVTIPDSVTTIGDCAFEDCSSLQEFNGKFASEDGRCLIIDGTLNSFAPAGLTEYTIPDSVATIGESAFDGCSSLTSLTIGDSVTRIGNYAFQGCSSLTSVTIPDSVTSIGDYAFYYCWSLTSVKIGNSVTTIGNYAFYNCWNLTSVYISDLSAWCRIGFEDYSANPLSYAKNLYLNNELVTDLVIPSDITNIKSYAFEGCSSLTSVTIPDSVTTIGNCAFEGCSSLTSVTIPDSVTSIEDAAFAGCSSLTSITIPDSVTTIGYRTFYNCSSLTSVTIGNSVTTIGEGAFEYCSSLTSITIPDSVTKIGDYAFFGCSSLPIIDNIRYADTYLIETTDKTMSIYTIKDNTRFIGSYAFQDCSSLTSITIPDSVTTIGVGAFFWCSSLTSVTIPDSVTEIGNYAFYKCSSLTSVYCKATTPPAVTLDYNGYWWAFDGNASGRKIYVPMESVNTYKSAEGWSAYKSYIVGYNF